MGRSRRRPRAQEKSGRGPAEFYDLDAPAWSTAGNTWDWLSTQQLQVSAVVADLIDNAGPATRRRYAIQAWLIENGYASKRWPRLPDWHRVGELKLPAGWQSDSIHERLARIKEGDCPF